MSNQSIPQHQLFKLLNIARNEVSYLRAENEELKANMEVMWQNLVRSDMRRMVSDNKLKESREENEKLENELVKADAEMYKMANRVRKCEQQLGARIKELEDKNEVSRKKIEELEQKSMESEVTRKILDHKLDESRKEIDILQARLVSSDDKMLKLADQCDQQNEKFGARIRDLDKENHDLKKENDQLEQQLSKMSMKEESQTVESPKSPARKWRRVMNALNERLANDKISEVQNFEEKLEVKKEKGWKMWINRSKEVIRMQEEKEQLKGQFECMKCKKMEHERKAFLEAKKQGRKKRWD